MSNETNQNAAQTNHIFSGKGGKMFKRISFILAETLVVNLFGMVAPTQAQLVEVPDVVGMHKFDASSAIHSAGLDVNMDFVPRLQSSGEQDNVISQDPVAGTMVPLGFSVDLVVGDVGVSVPNVVGMTESDAKKRLNQSTLHPIPTYAYSPTVPEGHVISQYPAEGAVVFNGSGVYLYISMDHVGFYWFERELDHIAWSARPHDGRGP